MSNSTVKKTSPDGYIPIRDTVKKCAGLGMSLSEIAAFCKTTKQNIHQNYRDDFEQGRANIVKLLRETQLDVALNDRNVPMLIHLGKFFLSQQDKQIMEVKQIDNTLDDVSTKDLIELVKGESDETGKKEIDQDK